VADSEWSPEPNPTDLGQISDVHHDQTINESISLLGRKVKRVDNISAGSFIESRHSGSVISHNSQNSMRLQRLKKERKLNLIEQKNLFVARRSS
jgi:hypothetical protein